MSELSNVLWDNLWIIILVGISAGLFGGFDCDKRIIKWVKNKWRGIDEAWVYR